LGGPSETHRTPRRRPGVARGARNAGLARGCAALALLAPPASSEDGGGHEPAVSFAREVRPILAERCLACHGPDAATRQARLRLDRPEGWLADLGGRAAVVPGDPGASELLTRVRAADEGERMPPPEHGPRLAPEQIATLERWIRAGATFERHWAYAPLGDPTPPRDVDPALVENDVDRFVLAALAREGLAPSPRADRRTLLRRVTFDLTGLPPTPDELAEFLADDSPDAYERAVERLLASRAYAEHWTRAWLDLARYADSNGFTIDGPRSMWPWRDWVLRAIDEDMPFDAFTVRQLAGDLLPGATHANVIATGFHRNTQTNEEGGAKDEENRVNAVHDRVATTAAVWLGTTLACAQCHDHKFDPFTQRDYYRLFAAFDSTEDGGVTTGPAASAPRTPEEEQAVTAYERRVALAEERLARATDEAAAGWRTWRPSEVRADNGTELVAELDGSFRAVGHDPEYAEYVLGGEVPPEGVAALRLEALPGVDLPGRGPGRSNGGNFVLSAVRVEWQPPGPADWRRVAIERAWADFEQDTRASGGGRYPAAGVLDEDPQSGWGVKPELGAPHVLHLALAQPLRGGRLRVALDQRFGSRHALGRFRLRSVGPDGAALVALERPQVPPAWRAAFEQRAAAADERPDLPTSLVLRERAEPRATHVFVRGSFLDPGERVTPGVPAALAHLARGRLPAEAEPFDRLALARWLASPDNALVLRVTVNRWWQAFFGAGLVETESDFGLRGASPSHPELLEWLARDFVAGGLSRKHVHRRIVTSATYRQIAPPQGALAERDPTNRLLARQRRLRLDAEAIRDAALVASGLYAPRFGGPPVQPPQPAGIFDFTQSARAWEPATGADRYRRTLYTRRWRSAVYPFLTTFDAPVPNVACTRRERTTSPLQALALANDPMMLELAAALGARARTEGGAGAAGVRRGFELALGREPSAEEEADLVAFVAAEEQRRRAAGAEPRLAAERAWAAFGRVLVNLDEFVTRP